MSRLDDFRRKKTLQLWPITMLRFYTGVFFLYYGFGKVRNPDFAEGLAQFVAGRLEESAGFIRPFLQTVVLPNNAAVALVVAWGELAIGLALIMGLATRWASIAGALMVAAFWATKGLGFLDAQNRDATWFMILVVLASIHAGRAHGLDERLSHRFRLLS